MRRPEPRASVTDDLVAWHGMKVKNYTNMVAEGIPLTVHRRQVWMDIITTEMKRRSKSKLSVGFIAYMGNMWEQGSGAFGKLTDKLDSSFRSPVSKKSGRSRRQSKPVDEKYYDEIIHELNEANYVNIDSQTVPFVQELIQLIEPQLRNRFDIVKLLSFLLHREQLARNPKPCLPYGDVGIVCLDTIESTMQMLLPLVHTAIVQLNLPRQETLWKLVRLSITEAYPTELRLRVMDHILVNGCAALVSVLLVYLQRRQQEFLLCTSQLEFESIIECDYHAWIQQGQFDTFWKECIEVHKSNFNQVYVARNIFMRAKHFTFNMKKSHNSYLPYHNDAHGLSFDPYTWIGFDIDHTLVEFKLEVLLRLTFEKAYRQVQSSYMNLRTCNPPVWIPHLAFRGVAIDTYKGNILHVGSDNVVLRAFHGTNELEQSLLTMQYPIQECSAKVSSFQFLYTNAEIIFAPIYAWLVDQYENRSITDAEIGYAPLPQEHKLQMKYLHPESVFCALSTIVLDATTAYYGSDYWRTLTTSPDVLLHVNAGVRRVLEMLTKTWKKNLFILTNGSWEHTDVVMKYSIGKDWRSFFELVLTKASKDVFFETYHGSRFREVLTFHNTRSITAASFLERGRVYEGGNITELMHTLNDNRWNGSNSFCNELKVLYMGDHPLHDIINPTKSATPWDTVAVIQETGMLFKHLEKAHKVRTKQVQTAIQLFLESICPCMGGRTEGPQVVAKPGLSTPCFYFDVGGPLSHLGKEINSHALVCVDSVSRLMQIDNTIQSLLQARLERRRDSVRASGPMSSTGLVTSKMQQQWSNILRVPVSTMTVREERKSGKSISRASERFVSFSQRPNPM